MSNIYYSPDVVQCAFATLDLDCEIVGSDLRLSYMIKAMDF